MTPAAKPPAFYGWKLSSLGCFANFMIQGSAVYLMNTFIQPFTEMYGWNRGDMGLVMGIGSFCGMASAPFLSHLAMRVSLRHIMLGGALVGAVTLFLFASFTNIWLFAVNFSLLWIAGQACGGVIANALMSNWFIRYRGRAFGVSNFGMSFSGAILPFTALVLLKVFSAQAATAALGVVVLVVLVPAVWFLVRDTPESMGLSPDGDTPPENRPHQAVKTVTSPAEAETDEAPRLKELVRSPLVWRIGIAFALSLLAAAGVVGQLKPRFSDLGFGDYPAMGLMCATAFFTACSKYIWGSIADRCKPLRTTRMLCLFSIGSYLLAFLPPGIPSMIIFSVFCGLGMGGYWTCLPAVVVSVFGRKHFMGVYRVISLFVLFKSTGYIVMGKAYQYTGSYDAAFGLFCVLSAVSFLLLPREGARYQRGPQTPRA